MNSNQEKHENIILNALKRLPKQHLAESKAQRMLLQIDQKGGQNNRRHKRLIFTLQAFFVLSLMTILVLSLTLSDELKSKIFPATVDSDYIVDDPEQVPDYASGSPSDSSFYLDGAFYYGDRNSFGIRKKDYFIGENEAELIFLNQSHLLENTDQYELKLKGIHEDDPATSHLLYEAAPQHYSTPQHTSSIEDMLIIQPTPILNFPYAGQWEVHATLNGEWLGSVMLEILPTKATPSCTEIKSLTLDENDIVNAVICGEEELFLVKRQIDDLQNLSIEEKLEAAMSSLLAGISEREKHQGLYTWFSERTTHLLNGVSVKEGIATINLSSQIMYEMNGANTSFGGYILNNQLKNTILQFDEIDGYIMQYDGSCQNYAEWSQVGVCTIIYRDGYEEINVEEKVDLEFYGPFTLELDEEYELIYDYSPIEWVIQIHGNMHGGIKYCPNLDQCFNEVEFHGIMRDEVLKDSRYQTHYVLDHVKSMLAGQIYHYFIQPREDKPDGYYLYFYNKGYDRIGEEEARRYAESFKVNK